MALALNWMDRAFGAMAPQMQLRRVRARVATELVLRHYEGAAASYRTQGWHRSSSDANAANGKNAGLSRLRDIARDLERNNPYAKSALSTIADHGIGWGIVAKMKNAAMQQRWDAWANSTQCDADGRHNMAGLQKLVLKSVARDGEVLARRRFRRASDGLAIPMQIQILEADFLDTFKDQALPNGGQIIQGVEFDAIGTRVAYWLYPSHPGASLTSSTSSLFAPSRRIPAEEIAHVYHADRPGQVRAPSWFAPVILAMKDLDEYADATLVKQKVSACLAVIMSDVDGSASGLGTVDNTTTPATDTISPGAVIQGAPGSNIQVVTPPTVREHGEYMSVNLRAIAAGIGVTCEDLTGDYSNMPFSAARMSFIRHWKRVEGWRWGLMIPQFCNPVCGWAMQAAELVNLEPDYAPEWTAPAAPMIDPTAEGLAYQRNNRASLMSLSEALRERGYDPATMLAEIQSDNALLDKLGIASDSDPRRMTQAGQAQSAPAAGAGAEV